MKKNIEITGEIDEVKAGYVGIRLHICDEITDFFAVDIEEKDILTRLNATTKILLDIEHTFEEYMKLISDLGLEMPSELKKHWTPKTGEEYYTIDMLGDVQNSRFSNSDSSTKLLNIYNIFPTKELAEKATNVSKLDRLILLWQYANGCLFVPDWRESDQPKYYIMYSNMFNSILFDTDHILRRHKVYFETEEQVEAFIDMYSEEIKKIMRVI